MDGAICSKAEAYGPLGASQAPVPGARSASSCVVANTWNSTQPTVNVTHCTVGSPLPS